MERLNFLVKKSDSLFCLLGVIALYSCGNGSGGESGAVQHDTVKTNSMASGGIKENIIETGEYIKHYPNGVIEMRGMMKNGKRDGPWKSWYLNGSAWSETEFKDGKKNGKTITWYDNEKKRYEGAYTNDEESGKWKFWDENGKLVSEKDYGSK